MSIDLVKFADNLRVAIPTIVNEAIRLASPKIEVLAAGGIRRGINEGVSPDGTPFEPLHFSPRPSGGTKPLLDKGLLAASVSAVVSGDELIMRANSPGARVQQFGATIVPKKAKALAIPLTREAARVGSPRRFPRPLFSVKGVLAERKGKKGGKIVSHYVFKASVTVPARPYLGVSDRTAGQIAEAVSDKYVDLINRVFGV